MPTHVSYRKIVGLAQGCRFGSGALVLIGYGKGARYRPKTFSEGFRPDRHQTTMIVGRYFGGNFLLLESSSAEKKALTGANPTTLAARSPVVELSAEVSVRVSKGSALGGRV